MHAIAKLQNRFPQTFPKNPAPKVPLKIGIFADLVQHAQELVLKEAELGEAIRTCCRGTRYWTCLVEGASRVDLAGQEAGNVDHADAKRAQQLQAGRAPRTRPKPANVPSRAGPGRCP
ncbi:ProQ/FinO family protein [Cupriavidus lacunae]|uniref:ProQ/FinO family protein n=1 Tax=Cupriavidus lacunae TaxID=2666307 RepID=UPI003CC66261